MDSYSPIDDDTFEQATRWYLRLRESPAPELHREHLAWLSGNADRVQVMAEVEALFGALHAPAIELVRQQASAVMPHASMARRGHRHRTRWAIAACIGVLAIAGIAWQQQGGYDRLRADAATAIGQVRTLQLQDGSKVTMDTDSALALDFLPGQRRVRLYRGRAHFEVAADPTRPFVVESAFGRAEVLGTVFDVRLQPRRTLVGVFKGRVRVANDRTTNIIEAGQAAWLGGDGIVPAVLGDADAAAAWQRGQLVFYRTPLADVVEELGRYRRGTVYVHGAALRAQPVSGVFETRDPDVALAALRDTLHLRSLNLPGMTVLY